MRIRAAFALLLLLTLGVTVLAQERRRHGGRSSKPAVIVEALPEDRFKITVDIPGHVLLPITVKRAPGDRFLLNDQLRRENGFQEPIAVQKQAIGIEVERR